MLYKPKYCCECSEKIERKNWRPWTNGRFCENCEPEQRLHVWLPRAGAILASAFLLFGIGSFLPRNESPLKVTTGQNLAALSAAANQKNRPLPAPYSNNQNSAPTSNLVNGEAAAQLKKQTSADPKSSENLRFQTRGNPPAVQNAAPETVYFCGAQTKKGAPCSRKVKGGGRCWQHTGQQALLPLEKLLISQ